MQGRSGLSAGGQIKRNRFLVANGDVPSSDTLGQPSASINQKYDHDGSSDVTTRNLYRNKDLAL